MVAKVYYSKVVEIQTASKQVGKKETSCATSSPVKGAVCTVLRAILELILGHLQVQGG